MMLDAYLEPSHEAISASLVVLAIRLCQFERYETTDLLDVRIYRKDDVTFYYCFTVLSRLSRFTRMKIEVGALTAILERAMLVVR